MLNFVLIVVRWSFNTFGTFPDFKLLAIQSSCQTRFFLCLLLWIIYVELFHKSFIRAKLLFLFSTRVGTILADSVIFLRLLQDQRVLLGSDIGRNYIHALSTIINRIFKIFFLDFLHVCYSKLGMGVVKLMRSFIKIFLRFLVLHKLVMRVCCWYCIFLQLNSTQILFKSHTLRERTSVSAMRWLLLHNSSFHLLNS